MCTPHPQGATSCLGVSDRSQAGKDGSFRLDSKKRPKEIDFTGNGKTTKGIYTFEKEQLKLVMSEIGQDRPTDFKSQAGTRQILIVMKRSAEPDKNKQDNEDEKMPVAGGLLYRLPEDSAFVRFEMETSSNEKGEGKKIHKGTLTMSSVGEVKGDGKLCRWLEIKMEAQTPGDHLVKVLIPSERLKAGESPLDHALKGWRKMSEGEPKEIANFKTMDAGAMPIILPGSLQDAKKLPKKIIDSKLGKLECAGHIGTHAFEPARDHRSEITYETWLHEKAPFGVVASSLNVKTFQNGEEVRTWTMTVRLVEVGKGAKSELPDHK